MNLFIWDRLNVSRYGKYAILNLSVVYLLCIESPIYACIFYRNVFSTQNRTQK